MTTRRVVRVEPSFFDRLDEQLGPERGPNGEPSSTDFVVYELPSIVDEFAASADDLAVTYPGRSDYRSLVVAGSLVATALVIGQIVGDREVVLLSVEIQQRWETDL